MFYSFLLIHHSVINLYIYYSQSDVAYMFYYHIVANDKTLFSPPQNCVYICYVLYNLYYTLIKYTKNIYPTA